MSQSGAQVRTATRRKFLSSSAHVLSATSLAAIELAGRRHVHAGSAAKRLELALIGVGVRGKYLLANLPSDFHVTALCDSSLSQVESARKPRGEFTDLLREFAEGDGQNCATYQDYRVMLQQQSFDAVIVAAPDHHHAQAAILSLQAGCHVYVEKPLGVTIAEGRAVVEAAEKYQRVVQVGSQQRTMRANQVACQFLREGGLGRIYRVDERNFPGPMVYDPSQYPAQTIPDDLDWDLFCGPTPLRAYHPNLWIKDAFKIDGLMWRGWDLFREYSGHLMTNWGAHSIDMIQSALGKDGSGPVRILTGEVQANGGMTGLDDQWLDKSPPLGSLKNVHFDQRRFQPLTMVYDDGIEVRFRPDTKSTVFYGEKGRMTLGRNQCSTEPKDLLPPLDPRELAVWNGAGHVARPHLQNWLDAILSGSPVNAPPEVGHRSASVCHLGNIARELSRELQWDPVAERFVDNALADRLVSRTRRTGFELPHL